MENKDYEIILKPQSQDGNLSFQNAYCVMTSHFAQTFGNKAEQIMLTAKKMVEETYHDNADYFQSFVYTDAKINRKFWLICDEHADGLLVLTAMLPEDY